jgi:LmeA-like phospholipid-binding
MKRIVVGLVVAIVLLVAVDCAAASATEYRLSSGLRTRLALSDAPAVTIKGFPFLAKAILGDYPQVDVTATNLTVGSMHNVGVNAELYNVRVPLSEVLSGSVRGAAIGSVRGSVLITKEDLVKQLAKSSKLLPGITRLSIQPVDDAALDAAFANSSDALPGSSVTGVNPDSAVRLSGTTSILGTKTDVSTIAVLELVGGQIQVTPRDIRLGNGSAATKLPEILQAGLHQMFTFHIDPGTLPFNVMPTRLRAVGDGLQISGVATNVSLRTP